MIRASDLKKGDSVKFEGDPHVVESVAVQTPGARGAVTLYKLRLRNLRSRRKTDQSFRGDDVLAEADLERRPVQVLFGDSSGYTFMDLQDYGQYSLSREEIAEAWPFLSEGLEGVTAVVSEGRVLGVELPILVNLTVIDTAPAVKGGSATARSKPATLSTGLVVQVPEYIQGGETVRVDTRTGQYVSKA